MSKDERVDLCFQFANTQKEEIWRSLYIFIKHDDQICTHFNIQQSLCAMSVKYF